MKCPHCGTCFPEDAKKLSVPFVESESERTILEEAQVIVDGKRQKDYGAPEDGFERIAKLWSGLLGVVISKEQVALMMILMKVARQHNKSKRDNWVDIAGYAECGSRLHEMKE